MMKSNLAVLSACALIFVLNACSPAGGNIPAGTSTASSTEDSPPSATLEINGTSQTAGLGTFCWNNKMESGESRDMCVDKIGLPTAHDPIVARTQVTAHLVLSLNEPPTQLEVSIFQATGENEVKVETGNEEFRYWIPAEGINRELALRSTQDIKLDIEPGLYVFYVFAVWDGKGDVSYGFLIDVK